VLRPSLEVERAARGFNPHHPKDKSYYRSPLMWRGFRSTEMGCEPGEGIDNNSSGSRAGTTPDGVVATKRRREIPRSPADSKIRAGSFRSPAAN
jgi:hypothetical protein